MFMYGDTITLLPEAPDNNFDHVVTGIPDMSELENYPGVTIKRYKKFFENAVGLCFDKCKKDGYCIFQQTDRKINGTWLDKSFMIYEIAKIYEMKLLWHKIVLLREPDKSDLHRPTYSHLLCFSKKGNTGGGRNIFPDVIPVSKKEWNNGTPELACKYIFDFISNQTAEKDRAGKVVLDPFCGYGAILAEAKKRGFSTVGIDINKDHLDKAKELIDSFDSFDGVNS